MNLDFLEIGTSDFNTLLQTAGSNVRGISVEPVKYYLDRLPNKPNVQKINCAISPTNVESNIEVFYLTVETIKTHRLPKWFKGCSNIGKIHPTIIKYNMQDYVDSYTVKQYPINRFLEIYDIDYIEYLKVDTEGHDCYILEHYFNFIKELDSSLHPKTIQFESNILTPAELVTKTVNMFATLGYKSEKIKIDTYLRK